MYLRIALQIRKNSKVINPLISDPSGIDLSKNRWSKISKDNPFKNGFAGSGEKLIRKSSPAQKQIALRKSFSLEKSRAKAHPHGRHCK
jgi:hypothetical protein